MDDVQSLDSSSKNGMFVIQPRLTKVSTSILKHEETEGTYSLLCSDEELTPVGIRSSVSHTDSVRLVMPQRAELVPKFLPPDTLSACSVS